jgi:hypothetical protein
VGEPSTANGDVAIHFASGDADRLLAKLSSRGLAVPWLKGHLVLLAALDVRPILAHLDRDPDGLTVRVSKPAALSVRSARRSSRVADYRISLAVYEAAVEASRLSAPERTDRLVAAFSVARAMLIGADGVRASAGIEVRGRRVRGGLPGLGRRR